MDGPGFLPGVKTLPDGLLVYGDVPSNPPLPAVSRLPFTEFYMRWPCFPEIPIVQFSDFR
jgi:hypothetical protein